MAALERGRVPPARPVSTGYADLDELLYGGLPPNLAVALTSPACNERDLLVRDFLETGARNGEITFYVTIDPGAAKPLAEEFPSNFHLFVCNPQADAIVEELPNIFKLKGVENLTHVSVALTSAIRKLNTSMKGPRRICLGLVSDVLLQHHAVQTRRWLTSLLAELKSTGFTTLAVIDPQIHPSEELYAILGLLDGDINIYEKETEKGLRRFLRIKKMGNSKYLEDELPLSRERLEIMPKVKPQESKTTQAVLDKHRIAVLPFVNMSPDPKDEYFADGMTEEIISTISSIGGLQVISRTSVMGYKGTSKKIPEIGKELKVRTVLEGSVRKADNAVRVTVQLIEVDTDKHLWSQNYDRELKSIFALQSEVAKQVAEALRVRILSPERERIEKKPTESTVAYTLYLKGRYLWNTRRYGDVKNAAGYFEQAVKEDPGFALGYVGLADCSLVLRNRGFDLQENQERAKKMVAKALELDPDLAEAHASMGEVLENEHNLREAENEFRRAIELKPNYTFAHMWYYNLLLYQLRWDEAQEQIETAVELDPLSPVINLNHGSFYYARGEYGKALELFKRTTTLDPDYAPGRYQMIHVYGRLRKFDYMRREADAFVELVKAVLPFMRMAADAIIAFYEDDGQTLRRLLPLLESNIQGPGDIAYSIAAFYFRLGENDKGFEWLEHSFSRGEEGINGVKCDPDFDLIRDDPRYLDLLKRLGLR